MIMRILYANFLDLQIWTQLLRAGAASWLSSASCSPASRSPDLSSLASAHAIQMEGLSDVQTWCVRQQTVGPARYQNQDGGPSQDHLGSHNRCLVTFANQCRFLPALKHGPRTAGLQVEGLGQWLEDDWPQAGHILGRTVCKCMAKMYFPDNAAEGATRYHRVSRLATRKCRTR